MTATVSHNAVRARSGAHINCETNKRKKEKKRKEKLKTCYEYIDIEVKLPVGGDSSE